VAVAVDILVGLGVAIELLACLGLVAMRNAIDRLHYAGAATVVGPTLIAAAVCVEEGLFTTNGLNAILVALMLALFGAALGTATARAIRITERGTIESTPAERERQS
jgi:multisubunit Na+/H+ antiporter MnhG subunit